MVDPASQEEEEAVGLIRLRALNIYVNIYIHIYTYFSRYVNIHI